MDRNSTVALGVSIVINHSDTQNPVHGLTGLSGQTSVSETDHHQ